MAITEFTGDFRFLSNFYPCTIALDGEAYRSVEHAYQAAKSFEPADRWRIRQCATAGAAKAHGKTVRMHRDWDDVKLVVMEGLLRQKFASGTTLSNALMETGDQQLIEGNTWGDTFWGAVRDMQTTNFVGANHLGRLLMKIRGELLAEPIRRIDTDAIGIEVFLLASNATSAQYRAQAKGHLSLFATGASRDEAIGKLILAHPSLFNLEIHDLDA